MFSPPAGWHNRGRKDLTHYGLLASLLQHLQVRPAFGNDPNMNLFLRLLFVGILAYCARVYHAGSVIGFSRATLQSPFHMMVNENAKAAAGD
jgi:hypothetical protein